MKFNDNFSKQLSIGRIKNKSLNVKRIFSLNREYQLSYKNCGLKKDPQYMDVQEIINYIQINYINHQGRNNKAKLINDLITFENYRDDLEGVIENRRNILSLWKYFITVSATLVTLRNMLYEIKHSKHGIDILNTGSTKKDILIIEIYHKIRHLIFGVLEFIKNSEEIQTIIIICILIDIFYKLAISYRNSSTNRLKTINQSIRVLENLKQHYY